MFFFFLRERERVSLSLLHKSCLLINRVEMERDGGRRGKRKEGHKKSLERNKTRVSGHELLHKTQEKFSKTRKGNYSQRGY